MTLDELKALIEANPVEGSPEDMRAAFRKLTEPVRSAVPAGQPVELAGLRGELHGHYGGVPILYFHGGGYVFGGPDSHRGLCHSLMLGTRRDVLVVDLPKAPENPWPAQKQAAADALRALSDRHGRFITLAGDSAGGHLALITALEQGTAEHCIAFSPNTLRDYALTDSRKACEDSDLMNDHAGDHALAEKAFGSIDPDDHDQTLTRRNLKALPLSYIGCGTDEVLRDDATVFAQKAISDGAQLALSAHPGFHLEELFAPLYAPGLWRIQDASDWLRSIG